LADEEDERKERHPNDFKHECLLSLPLRGWYRPRGQTPKIINSKAGEKLICIDRIEFLVGPGIPEEKKQLLSPRRGSGRLDKDPLEGTRWLSLLPQNPADEQASRKDRAQSGGHDPIADPPIRLDRDIEKNETIAPLQ
jgi:hypothetical protein